MRLRGFLFCIVLSLVMTAFGQSGWVNGYRRKDGTYVPGHFKKPTSAKAPKKPSKPRASTTYKPPKAPKLPSYQAPKPKKQEGFVSPNGKWVEGYYRKDGTYVKGHYVKPRAKKLDNPFSSPSGPWGTPSKTSSKSSGSGIAIRSTTDDRFSVGDRIVSVRDASGKTFSINSADKLTEFLRSHRRDEDYTVRIRRDGKYLTRKVKRFGESVRF